MKLEETKLNPIVPHSASAGTSGWDMLKVSDDIIIIRNDIDESTSYFMNCSSLTESKPETDVMFHSMRAQAYVGYNDNGSYRKYAIDETTYWSVTGTKTGEGMSEVHDLHADYQGGDHYLVHNAGSYSINLTKGTYWVGNSLGNQPTEKTLRSDLVDLNPIAMYGDGDYYYVLTMDPSQGLVVKHTSSLEDMEPWTTQRIGSSLITFMPGGVSSAYGSSDSQW